MNALGGRCVAESIQIEGLDHARVVVDDQVDDQLGAALERVDVMEGEKGTRLEGTVLAAFPVDDEENGPALRLPAEVLDEGLAAETKLKGIDDEGAGGDDEVALAETEAVHVGRLAGRDLGEDALRFAILLGINAVLGAGAELGGKPQQLAGLAVVMGVSGDMLAGRRVGTLAGFESLGVEGDRHRRLGDRDQSPRRGGRRRSCSCRCNSGFNISAARLRSGRGWGVANSQKERSPRCAAR